MSEHTLGGKRVVRRVYGFDEIALVPGSRTCDIELCDVSVNIGKLKLSIPILASAMDSVVDVKFASEMSRLGGLAVLNLQGLQTRFEDLSVVYEEIIQSDSNNFVAVMQKLYASPVRVELIEQRIAEIKSAGGIACVSVTPNMAEQYGRIAQSAGCDLLVIQSTVTGLEHKAKDASMQLDLEKFCRSSKTPIIVGNCVSYKAAYGLMETGIDGLLVGVGPGAACTSRSVLGIGVPMATAIADCAQARADFKSKTGRDCMIVADGGMVVGGDICKAIACGADCVMIGSPLAKAKEAPGKGFHWGMATPSPVLPRGTRIKVGTTVGLEQILFGPAGSDNGTENLIGALRTSMSTLGACTIEEMQAVEVIIAPSILNEGKVFQHAQKLGMGR